MRRAAALLAAVTLVSGALAASPLPAAAQMIVHDPTSYGSLIRQAQTALDQLNTLKGELDEARRLYGSLNTASGAGELAARLAAPEVRAFVPDADAFVAAAQGDLAALGRIGALAKTARESQRLYAAAPSDALGQELERAGDRAARDLALGQATAATGAQRLTGLSELAARIDAAPNARAVLDLQARLAAEQALIANDQMRLQGVAMAQAAEERLAVQRERERAAAAIEARLALFRGSLR